MIENKESVLSPVLPKKEKMHCIRKRLKIIPSEYVLHKTFGIYIPKSEQNDIYKNADDNIQERFNMLIEYEKNKNASITILKEI